MLPRRNYRSWTGERRRGLRDWSVYGSVLSYHDVARIIAESNKPGATCARGNVRPRRGRHAEASPETQQREEKHCFKLG